MKDHRKLSVVPSFSGFRIEGFETLDEAMSYLGTVTQLRAEAQREVGLRCASEIHQLREEVERMRMERDHALSRIDELERSH